MSPLPLRSRGAVHLVSVQRAIDGVPGVVLVPAPGADPAAATATLLAVERAHALLDHPQIPRVRERGEHEGAPFLDLACDAVIDGVEALRLVAEAGLRLPYAAADGFIAGLRKVLQAAHATIDPETGGPVCLGRLSLANVLVSPDGRFHLVGFGRNFPVERDDGAPDGLSTFFQAPELWTGGPPTPTGDFAALLLLMRSLMPFVELSGRLARIFQGEIGPEDAPLIELFQWFDRRFLSESPKLRPSVAEAVAVSDQIREAIGVVPDAARFSALIASVIEPQERPAEVPPGEASDPRPALQVGLEVSWFAVADGERTRLGRAPRRILSALLAQHRAQPGVPLSLWALLEAGWPGERPVLEAGANRVYVAIARLRAQGLREVIDRFDDGYRIAPRTVVRVVDGG